MSRHRSLLLPVIGQICCGTVERIGANLSLSFFDTDVLAEIYLYHVFSSAERHTRSCYEEEGFRHVHDVDCQSACGMLVELCEVRQHQ